MYGPSAKRKRIVAASSSLHNPYCCQRCMQPFFSQRSLSLHMSQSDVCRNSWQVPPEPSEFITLPRNAAPMFEHGESSPRHLWLLGDDDEDPYQPADGSDSGFPSYDEEDRDDQPTSPRSRLDTSTTSDHSLPYNFDTSVTSSFDEEEDKENGAMMDDEEEAGVDTASEPRQQQFMFTSSDDFPSDASDIAHLNLVKILNDIGAPLSAFHTINRWASESIAQGHEFGFDCPHYSTYINSLTNRLNLDGLSYEMRPIELPWGGMIKIPVFDFREMFLSLVDHPWIRDSLLIDWENPSAIPNHDSSFLDEIHSAQWYKETHAQKIRVGSNQVLSAALMFTDRTHTADKDRLGCECVFISLSIIPREHRNSHLAWRPLGMLPKFDSNRVRGQNTQAYHLCLAEILKGLRHAQACGGITTSVLNPVSKEVTLTFVTPICALLGDVEGHDKHCGRFGSHSTQVLCRECNCRLDNADNPHEHCSRTSAKVVADHVSDGNTEWLKDNGYHNVVNAYTPMDFGANKLGVNGCCPAEVLHFVQSGLMKYAHAQFYADAIPCGNMPARYLDKLCSEVSIALSKQSDRDYPRTKFPLPVSKDSQFRSCDYPGGLLVIIIALHMHCCWAKSGTATGADENSPGNSSHVNNKDVEDYRNLFELLLAYEVWYRLDKVPKQDVVDGTATNATRSLLDLYKRTVKREGGLGLKLTKFHCSLHVEYNLRNLGSNNNTHSGPMENNHKDNIKKPAKNTQRRKSTFDQQIAKRLKEKLVIRQASALVDEANKQRAATMATSSAPVGGTRFTVHVKEEENVDGDTVLVCHLTWCSAHKSNHPNQEPPGVALDYLAYLVDKAVKEQNLGSIDVTFECFTEHKREGQIFRAHPNYRKEGAWYDWAQVAFAPDEDLDTVVTTKYPSQIWLFVDLSAPIMIHDEYGGTDTDIREYLDGHATTPDGNKNSDGLYAVVTPMAMKPEPLVVCNSTMQSSPARLKRERKSVCTSLILRSGKRHNRLWLVPVAAINEAAMVVDNFGRRDTHSQSLIYVRPRSEWPDEFVKLGRQ